MQQIKTTSTKSLKISEPLHTRLKIKASKSKVGVQKLAETYIALGLNNGKLQTNEKGA